MVAKVFDCVPKARYPSNPARQCGAGRRGISVPNVRNYNCPDDDRTG